MSFTPHSVAIQHFINDSEEDIEGRLIGLVADHTKVLMLVTDRCESWNNHQVERLSQNQQEAILKTVMKTL